MSTQLTRSAIPVSLVIPVRDEAATIAVLLDSIRAQTLPPDEIIFVDGGSKDDRLIQLGSASQQDARIRIFEAQDATPGRGRNVGIAAAIYDWIALTDAGIGLDTHWLERLLPESGVKTLISGFEWLQPPDFLEYVGGEVS